MPVMENNAELTYACNEFQLSGLSYCKSIVKKDLEMLGAWDVSLWIYSDLTEQGQPYRVLPR